MSMGKSMSSSHEGNTKKHTRSRFGCQRCKRLKVKCDEVKPSCSSCVKSNEICDYSLKLKWGGRPFKKKKPVNMSIGTVVSFAQKYNTEKANADENQGPTKRRRNVCSSDKSSPFSFASKAETARKTRRIAENNNTAVVSPAQSRITRTARTLAHEQLPPQVQSFKSLTDSLLNHSSLDDDTFMLTSRQPESFSSDLTNASTRQILESLMFPETIIPIMNSDESELSPSDFVIMENFHSFKSTSLPSPGFTDQLNFLTGLETIPLQIQPLPDLLLNNPLYRENYHNYIEVFSKTLVPAPPRLYKDNPFTCLLPQISLSSGTCGILAILVAFGLCQSAAYKGEPYPKSVMHDLITIALDDLCSRYMDPIEASSDTTLALILALSTFELICRKTNAWRAHFFGAKSIMLSRGLLSPVGKVSNIGREELQVSLVKGPEADLPFFLTRWFAYSDIVCSMSSSSLAFSYPDDGHQFIWKTLSPSRGRDRELLEDIDLFMGFDLELLQCFSRINKLVKEKESMKGDKDLIPISLVHGALEVKDEILEYLEKSEHEREEIERTITHKTLIGKLPDYHILRSTNLVYGLSAVLQIYRRVLRMPRDSPMVQRIVKRVARSLELYTDTDHPAACGTIFGLFAAGCESVDGETRELFMGRLQELADKGWFSARIGAEIMTESWTSGEHWADIVATRQVDVVFL